MKEDLPYTYVKTMRYHVSYRKDNAVAGITQRQKYPLNTGNFSGDNERLFLRSFGDVALTRLHSSAVERLKVASMQSLQLFSRQWC